MATDYVSADTAKLLDAANGTNTLVNLLWGDRVRTSTTSGAWTKVKARGQEGWVRTSELGGKSLLECYFIDVGQGDGVLIRTPDDRHILIDGGFNRKNQPSGKNAADFVDWKFVKDYGQTTIALDAMVASHNDADHYGGLWDLLSDEPSAAGELDATDVTVEKFFHSGLSWWKNGDKRTLGPSASTSEGPMWTQLLDDRASAVAAIGTGAGKKLHGEWAKFIECVTKTKKASNGSTPFHRLSHEDKHLPGFAPAPGKASIRVLGPVTYDVGGKPALRKFSGGDSKNTNGQSSLLRIDYGRARVLLTGDLNTASQAALLKDYEGNIQELECDVAKACHHGSDDVSYKFLQAMRPAVTVISSGDNEGHDHPRPGIVAASATAGYLTIENDRMVSPLVYSTELARSHRFTHADLVKVTQDPNPALELKNAALKRASVRFKRASGRVNTLTMDRAFILSDLVYGLVNVRTDGERILCATMNEKDATWQIKTLKSRF